MNATVKVQADRRSPVQDEPWRALSTATVEIRVEGARGEPIVGALQQATHLAETALHESLKSR
jgi:hypothetical protein